ncbi:MAG: hypothetical protein P8074_07700 [Anaerolineales bacterium]|jgi:Tol biopolymer transport system component
MKKLKFLIITCLSTASLVTVYLLILVQSSGQAAPFGAMVDPIFDDEFNVELTGPEMGFVSFDQEFTAQISINPLEFENHLPIVLNTCFLGTDQILYEDDFDLFVMNSDGSCLTKLSDPATAQDWSPSWSPDGTQIAFLTSEGVPCCTPAMHLMDADGSNETDTPGFGGQPVWSPDGTKIAFSYRSAQPFPSSSIYFFQLSGSNSVLLAGEAMEPVWSPDSSKIAFTSFAPNDRKINLMNADGSNRIELATDEAYSPSWSPDGTRIAYLVYNVAEMAYDIYLMQPDGLNQTKLTGHVASAQRPAWSPDGLQIAFTSNMDSNNEVYVIDVDGTGLTNLTNHPATDNFLNWSPDGSEILFESSRFTPFQFAIMFADGSSPRGLGVHGNSATWRPSP